MEGLKLSETARGRILAAMLDDSNRTLSEIATSAGISRKSLYNCLHEPAFAEAYTRARDVQIIKRAEALEARRERALATTEALMDDETAPPAVRLKAASTLLTEANAAQDKADTVARSTAFGASAGF